MSRAALLLVALAACKGGGHGAPFGPPERVAALGEVADVVADAGGVVALASGDPGVRHGGTIVAVDGAGAVTTLDARIDGPGHLALTATDAYFLVPSGVQAAARSGDGARTIARVDGATAIAIAGADVLVGAGGHLLAYDHDGAGRVLVADAGSIADLAVDDAHVYWLDAGGRVVRARRDGTEVTVLAGDQVEPAAMALAGDAVVWVTRGDPARQLAATVATVPAAGGAVRVLQQGGQDDRAVAVDGGWVYWTDGTVEAGTVHRVRLTG
ncbi:MAG TPA: hypothetical protein VHE35_31210, partial [Kofleriaceae bacterium]|nr:hypothetical protein [Kofleriaceae bacterium]